MVSGDTHILRLGRLHQQHNEERRELQQLNETFSSFIQRVKSLEDKNHQLQKAVESVKRNWGFDSVKVREKYEGELLAWRKELDKAAQDMQATKVKIIKSEREKVMITNKITFVDRIIGVNQQALEFSKQEYERTTVELGLLHSQAESRKQDIEQSKSELKRQEDYLNTLNQEYESELLARLVLETQIQTLNEELVFLKAVYEEENGEFATLGTYQIDLQQFYRDELARAISLIRNDFEVVLAAQLREWDGFYNMKIQQIQKDFIENKRRRSSVGHVNDPKGMDINALGGSLEDARAARAKLANEHAVLQERLEQYKEEHKKVQLNNRQSQNAASEEYAALSATYQQLREAVSNMEENMVTLQFEINTYRRLLESVHTVESGKKREIALLWSNSSSVDFSASDSKEHNSLLWLDSVKVTTEAVTLPLAVVNPKNASGVLFFATYYASNERVIVEATISDQFNFSNYGAYELTIFYPNSQFVIGTWTIHIEPKGDICMPRRFVIRDSINRFLADTTLQISLNGRVVFSEMTNENGEVNIPQDLQPNSYDIEINTHKTQYKIARFERIVFPRRGPDSLTYFVYRQMEADELEFLLTWGERPSDLDSHVYVSDGRHVYFSHKHEPNVSLDCDCREGSGPETMKIKLEPTMKYVYAIHRYSKDGELARSNASVSISTDEDSGVNDPFQVVRVPFVDQPEANFWIVCQIDGTTKKITFFDRAFENQDSTVNDAWVQKYFDQ